MLTDILKATLAASFAVSLSTGPAIAGTKVLISTTLNSTIHVYDTETLEELQPPIVSRGGGPVRLFAKTIDGIPYVFSANHGIAGSSLGIFDLSGPVVLEAPLSPAPSAGGVGAVGVSAGIVKGVPMAFIGNTYFALAPCDVVPNGSVTGFDLSLIGVGGLATAVGTTDISGGLAWGVSVDPEGRAFVTSNCGGTLDVVEIAMEETPAGAVGPYTPRTFTMTNTATLPSGNGADNTIFDEARRLVYTGNIGGRDVVVHDPETGDVLTIVPLPKDGDDRASGPIDVNFADSETLGKDWLITANGSNDTVGIVDRDIVDDCITNAEATCARSVVGLVFAGRDGGSPEGLDFDPETNRIFVVNKPIPSPSFSVVEITAIDELGDEDPFTYTVSSEVVADIPLNLLGANDPGVPNLIAFDVAVQK